MPELRDHTTLRLGGPADSWVRATTEQQLIDALVDADTAGVPVLVLGGGSNLVVADAGFAGTVIEVATSVGLPGVIAHGMYTMALAARAVSTWYPGAEVVSLGCKFTNPVVVPAEGGVDIEVAGETKSVEGGLATVVLTVTCEGQKVLGMPKAVLRVTADG